MVLASTSVLVIQQTPNMAATSMYVLRGCPSDLLPLWEQVGLTQTPFKLLPLCWVSEDVRSAMLFLRVKSLLLPSKQAMLTFKARKFWGLIWCRTPELGSWGANIGLKFLAPWGGSFAILIICLFVGCLPQNVVLSLPCLCCSYPSCCGSFFISLVVENLFY